MKIFPYLPSGLTYVPGKTVPVTSEPNYEVVDMDSTDTTTFAELTPSKIHAVYKSRSSERFGSWIYSSAVCTITPGMSPREVFNAMSLAGFDILLRIPARGAPPLDPALIDDD